MPIKLKTARFFKRVSGKILYLYYLNCLVKLSSAETYYNTVAHLRYVRLGLSYASDVRTSLKTKKKFYRWGTVPST